MHVTATRVFIVDDHPLVREWLANLLGQQTDVQVLGAAASAREGLSAMQADPPDVAIVDLSLQNTSGLDLIKDLAAVLPQTRIIVLSMHEEVGYAQRALRAGARGYVTKRESTEQIVEALREVASGRFYASRAMLGALTERSIVPSTGPVESLSDREMEVFNRLGNGQSTRRIADDLNVSIKTVHAYCARIKDKMGYADAAELVCNAVRWVVQRDPSV